MGLHCSFSGSEPRVEVEEEEEKGWGDLFGEYMKELKEADSWTEWLGKVKLPAWIFYTIQIIFSKRTR